MVLLVPAFSMIGARSALGLLLATSGLLTGALAYFGGGPTRGPCGYRSPSPEARSWLWSRAQFAVFGLLVLALVLADIVVR